MLALLVAMTVITLERDLDWNIAHCAFETNISSTTDSDEQLVLIFIKPLYASDARKKESHPCLD